MLKTTPLWNRTPLVYGNGVGSGAPTLNATDQRFYFTGRSDNFDPTQTSADINDGRFDPESVRISPDGDSVFVSDEYGPYLYQFDRRTGAPLHAFKLPDNLAVATPSPQKAVEIVDIATGATCEYAYGLTNIGAASDPRYGTVSDAVAVNDHELPVDERDGHGLGDDTTAVEKHLYLVDLDGARDVSDISGEANPAARRYRRPCFSTS